MVLNILAFVLFLTTLQPPLDDGTFPLLLCLLPDFQGCTFYQGLKLEKGIAAFKILVAKLIEAI